MEKKIDIDEMLRTEWRELGIYYQHDEQTSDWLVFGHKNGIKKFATAIYDYCDRPENAGLSEHIHFGPYSYLKVMTWDRALITKEFIAGTIPDLRHLGELIIRGLESHRAGETFAIDKEFGPSNEVRLLIELLPDDFDPVSMDSQLNK